MRVTRTLTAAGLVLVAVLYVVGWVRVREHIEYLRSGASAWDHLLWLGTSVAVVTAGGLALLTTLGLLRGREPRPWVTWATLVALGVAGVLPAARAMTVARSEIPFLPDPFRDHGPAFALYLAGDDPFIWRHAVVPFTVLALLWAGPVLVTELTRGGSSRTVAGIAALCVLTAAFLHGLLGAVSVVAFT